MPRAMRGLMFRLNNTMIVVDRFGECSAEFVQIIDTLLTWKRLPGVRGTL